MINTKEDLHTHLCVALRNFIFGHIMNNRFKKDMSIPKTVTFDTGTQSEVVDVSPLFRSSDTNELIDPNEVFGNFTKSLSRAVIAEAFELIKLYCIQTSQYQTFKSWKYFEFNRIIRNCTSHGTGGTLHRWPPDLEKKGIFEVEWMHKKITKNMVGNSISILNDPEIIQFTKDQISFVDSELS